MTDEQRERLAQWAVISLTVISVLGIAAGVVVAYFGSAVGAVIAVVTGAVGGIVAIVLRDKSS